MLDILITMFKERTTARQGFTLVELLIVIAIIGVLSAIVLTQLQTARNNAFDTQMYQGASVLYRVIMLEDAYNLQFGTPTEVDQDCSYDIFADPAVELVINHLESSTGESMECGIGINGASFAAGIQNSKTGNLVCVSAYGVFQGSVPGDGGEDDPAVCQ